MYMAKHIHVGKFIGEIMKYEQAKNIMKSIHANTLVATLVKFPMEYILNM